MGTTRTRRGNSHRNQAVWPDRAVIEHRANTKGRDLIAGDIHGHFETLERALETLRFDPTADRLFSIGDLIDRDPRSEAALGWITEARIAAVRVGAELFVGTVRNDPSQRDKAEALLDATQSYAREFAEPPPRRWHSVLSRPAPPRSHREAPGRPQPGRPQPGRPVHAPERAAPRRMCRPVPSLDPEGRRPAPRCGHRRHRDGHEPNRCGRTRENACTVIKSDADGFDLERHGE